jgi:hypothetical protein
LGAEAGPRDWRGMIVGMCEFILVLRDSGGSDCEMYCSVAEVMSARMMFDDGRVTSSLARKGKNEGRTLAP